MTATTFLKELSCLAQSLEGDLLLRGVVGTEGYAPKFPLSEVLLVSVIVLAVYGDYL